MDLTPIAKKLICQISTILLLTTVLFFLLIYLYGDEENWKWPANKIAGLKNKKNK